MPNHLIPQIYLVLCGFLFAFALARSASRTVNNDNPPSDSKHDRSDERVPFYLEETYTGEYLSYSFNATWISDNEIVYLDGITGDIVKFDIETRRTTVLFEYSVLENYKGFTYSISPDESYLLIGHNTTTAFRHSAFRKYVVYDKKRKTYEDIANGAMLPLAMWLPFSNDIIYVYENDIYYQRFTGDDKIRRLTTTGVPGVIYNGIPDWVYEEEVLHGATALWFSEGGDRLAFATFNDTEVKDALYFHYGVPGSLKYQYPTEVKLKYPKAGTPNPAVSLSLIDLSDPESKLINLAPPIDIVGNDCVLFTVNWIHGKVLATWTNRVQNKAQMVVYDVTGDSKNLLLLEEEEGWLDISLPIYTNDQLIMRKSQDSGTSAGKFMHITKYDYNGEVLSGETDLTPGAVEVQALLSVDHINQKIYYLATAPNEPSQRNLYSVPLSGKRAPICVSCGALTPEGNNCTYGTAAFSTLRSYYTLMCAGPDPMYVAVYDEHHKQVLVLEGNEPLREKLAKRLRPTVKNLYVKANGYDCKVRLLLPPDFDERKSYPLLVNVYAGPGTVRITDAASYGFHSYMATNRSVIYAWIDGRGSAYKGSKMLFEIYRNFGTVEVEDQISVTHILQNTYPWIDANRTAVWGWSYGGFSTATILATDKNSVFKCGISVAPVTSWIYYDSIYTERYMGLPTPEDNLSGYNRTDVTRKVEGIRGKKFMLIHGTGDDNVHYQQALLLAKALEIADIPFEQVTYTDEAHGLVGVAPHFYHTMDRFWANCLYASNAQ